MSLAEALVELQALTERLRRDCPWDREQTERTIVPHTVEEAYEVADAAIARDDFFICLVPRQRVGDADLVERDESVRHVVEPRRRPGELDDPDAAPAEVVVGRGVQDRPDA